VADRPAKDPIKARAGRIGAHRLHALRGDTAVRARQAFQDSFRDGHKCQVCRPIVFPADLPEAERARRASHAYKAHMVAIATLPRGRKKAATV
jgi:hypothetical protein